MPGTIHWLATDEKRNGMTSRTNMADRYGAWCKTSQAGQKRASSLLIDAPSAIYAAGAGASIQPLSPHMLSWALLNT